MDAQGEPVSRTALEEYLLKIVVVGSMGVGKSSLLLRYIDDSFQENYIATIGVDFKMKNIERPGCLCRVQLWDTAGQERFRSIASSFYRGADGLIVVFDVTDMDSFEKVPFWLQEADQKGGSDNIVTLLVGNKTDKQDERVVDGRKAQALADKLGVKYFETSAKDATNVALTFDAMADSILKKKKLFGLSLTDGGRSSGTVNINSKDVSESYYDMCVGGSWCSYN